MYFLAFVYFVHFSIGRATPKADFACFAVKENFLKMIYSDNRVRCSRSDLQ